MKDSFSVKLIDRTEAVEYREDSNTYQFDLGKEGRTWIIYLPSAPDTAPGDADRILARITAYLRKRWWFGVFPMTYDVRVESKST